jgi:hypothetical protein
LAVRLTNASFLIKGLYKSYFEITYRIWLVFLFFVFCFFICDFFSGFFQSFVYFWNDLPVLENINRAAYNKLTFLEMLRVFDKIMLY